MLSDIRAIVFDLDGTLYADEGFAREIFRAVCEYAASIRGISAEDAEALVKETRDRLSAIHGSEATLTSVCRELGGDVAGFHRAITPKVHPEAFLRKDERVVELLGKLATRFDLYVYTNNNAELTSRILSTLGISGLFRRVFTIEDYRQPKPDRAVLEKLYSDIGRAPDECLFVGDRFDVDLRLPAEMGSAVFLVGGVMELLNLTVPVGEKGC